MKNEKERKGEGEELRRRGKGTKKEEKMRK
jgi:hypothetical protein